MNAWRVLNFFKYSVVFFVLFIALHFMSMQQFTEKWQQKRDEVMDANNHDHRINHEKENGLQNENKDKRKGLAKEPFRETLQENDNDINKQSENSAAKASKEERNSKPQEDILARSGNRHKVMEELGALKQKVAVLQELEEIDQPVKVIFLTYSRSGSSFLGEVINRNPDGFYYFEPLKGIYSALYTIPDGMKSMAVFSFKNGTDRFPPLFEAQTIASQLYDLLSCNLIKLPVDLFQDFFTMQQSKEKKFAGYKACLRKGKGNRIVDELETYNGTQNVSSFTAAFNCKNRYGKQCGSFFDDKREYRCFEETFGIKYPNMGMTLNSIADESKMPHLAEEYQQLIPQRFAADKKLESHNRCILTAQRYSDRCIQKLDSSCKETSVRGAKVIRMRMENVALLLAKDPNIKIVHYFRDPRGLELSRSKGMRGNKDRAMINDAIITCRKMRQDIKIRKQLEKVYPENFMVLRYEDLAMDSTATAEKIYSFLNIRMPPEVQKYVASSTNGTTIKRPLLSTASRNGTAVALKWMSEMSAKTAKTIGELCQDILLELGYEL